MSFLNAVLANVVWILLVAVLLLAVYWVVASRLKSDHWGHPEEFAGTMPDEAPSREEEIDRAFLEGRLTEEDLTDPTGRGRSEGERGDFYERD